MMKLLVSLVLVFGFVSDVYGEPLKDNFRFKNEDIKEDFSLQAVMKDGKEIKVSVKIAPGKDVPYKDGFLWGTWDYPPKYIITNIEVKVGNKDIFVPLSAYMDLFWPLDATIGLTKDGFTLWILGGDAAASYEAFIRFSNDTILSRLVMSGEFPTTTLEETKYTFIDPEAMVPDK